MTTYRIDRDGEIIEQVTVLDSGRNLIRVQDEHGQVYDLGRRRITQDGLQTAD